MYGRMRTGGTFAGYLAYLISLRARARVRRVWAWRCRRGVRRCLGYGYWKVNRARNKRVARRSHPAAKFTD